MPKSKYISLWEYIAKQETAPVKLTFDEIKEISGVPIDHSFLNYKKELTEYGWRAEKISMKEKTVLFLKA